jgi:hypothetical protein
MQQHIDVDDWNSKQQQQQQRTSVCQLNTALSCKQQQQKQEQDDVDHLNSKQQQQQQHTAPLGLPAPNSTLLQAAAGTAI